MPIDQGNELVYQVGIYMAGFFPPPPKKKYIFPCIKFEIQTILEKKSVNYFSLIEKIKPHMENDKLTICHCNIMQCFPGVYSLDK